MKKSNTKLRSCIIAEQTVFLELLKERSCERHSRIEAYLDLVNKASEQYCPKELDRKDYDLAQGHFVTTITGLAECWHWHRATVRTFLESLETLKQITVTRLAKSQVIGIPSMFAEPATSSFDCSLEAFRHKLQSALSTWASGKMTASACAVLCEQYLKDATDEYTALCAEYRSGNPSGIMPYTEEEYGQACCKVAITCICQSTLLREMTSGDDAETALLVEFFNNDAEEDWSSFLTAVQALAELTTSGRSATLEQESDSVKAQFQKLCKPFLALATSNAAASI